jgi:hypothetical protein
MAGIHIRKYMGALVEGRPKGGAYWHLERTACYPKKQSIKFGKGVEAIGAGRKNGAGIEAASEGTEASLVKYHHGELSLWS